MAVKKRIFLIGFVITVLIFISIVLSNSLINEKREDVVVDRMNAVVEEYEDMQTLLLMSDFFGEEATCVALKRMLANMNKELWGLGQRIDSYRMVTEEFRKNPFYVEQKKTFNRREVLYFSMLKRMKEMCDLNQTIVTYFYRKKEECPDCDAQSFVLSDIKHDLENIDRDEELAIFSFDVNMELPSIDLLVEVYNVTEYPCVIIENTPHCGLRDKDELKSLLCSASKLSIC